MTVHTSAGTKIYIGGKGPLLDESAFQLIGEIVNPGEFGRVYEEIQHTSLDNRNVRKFKGSRNDGNMNMQLGRDPSDDGQADLIVALDDDDDYNFKVELNDDPGGTGDSPTTILFKAKVMSYTTNIGDANSIVAATALLGIQSGTIVETAAIDVP
jgi:hypothetical protein